MGTDPFQFPISIIPHGMSYQWCTKTIMGEPTDQFKKFVERGWRPVPTSRHPGVFMTETPDGWIEVKGCLLMERSTADCEKSAQDNSKAAHYMVERSLEKMAEKGFCGGIEWATDETSVVGNPIDAQKIINPFKMTEQ